MTNSGRDGLCDSGAIEFGKRWSTDSRGRLIADPEGGGWEVEDNGAKENGQLEKASSAAAGDGKESGTIVKKEKASKEPTVSFFRLFSFADMTDYLLMFVGTVGAIVHGCTIPIFLLFFGTVLNGLGGQIGSSLTHTVSKISLYLVWLGLATLVSSWMEVSFWMLTGDRQAAKLRTTYLTALLRQDVQFFDTNTNTGDVVSSIASEPVMVQDAISEKMGSFIHFMSTFVCALIVACTIQWRIALVTIAILPLIAVTGASYAFTLSRSTARAALAYAEAGTIAEQAISQVRTVYSFVSETKFINAYSTAVEKTMKFGTRGGLVKGVGMGITMAVIYPCFGFLLWYGGVLVRQGRVNGGEALSSIFSVIVASTALGQSMPYITAFAKGKAAAYRIFKIIDHKPTINVVDDNSETLDVVQGHIELRNVDFAYPSRPDVFVFRNFSLVIPSGKTVALVGSSGSGKSTIVSLIERFYDPAAGEVLIDGYNIKKLNLKWLRGRIGLVSQEPALFATTIAANILYGKDNATAEEIEAAAEASNAHSFIEKLPLGYQTQVGEKGIQLSGGQKQRVAIARAMLRNPAVLLLDEATSALDAGSEHIVQEALDRLMVGRTTIVVAHRLSTIRNADIIAVVQQGQIVEKGTHQELISRDDGAYSSLVRLQEMAATKGASMRKEDSMRIGSARIGFSSRFSQGSRSAKSFSFSMLRGGSVKSLDRGEDGESLIDDESGEVSKGSFVRLLAMCKPQRKYALTGLIGSMLAGCQNPVFGLILGEVLVAYYQPKSRMKKDVAEYALILVALGVSSLFIYVLQHYSLAVMGENLVQRVRQTMFGTILRNEMGWFDQDENSSGQILARLNSDATNVSAAIGDRLAVILQNLTLILTAWIISFFLQWKLALVLIATSPLLVLSASAQKLFLKGFAGDQSTAYARATQVAGEAVTNIRTVAAFHAENKVQALFIEELKGPAGRSLLRGQVAGLGLGLAQCLMYWSYGLGMWYGGRLIYSGAAQFGNVIKVFLILMISASSMAETLALAPDLIKAGQAVASVFEVLDRKTTIDPEDPEGSQAEKILGHVQLKNVTFSYPARPDVIIFKDLNLRVRSGRSLALVGASGSGKSSVIALIERFYDPLSGQVLIDGKDLKTYNLRSVRLHIALVSQEPALFAYTIYENIICGKDGATEAEVIEAAKAANAHEFISSLPDGYQTNVGERGVQLSGGQKQRVAIARGVLKNPAILLLDEATSALDSESEKVVQAALDRLMKGRTTILIAHRLSTIRGANSIAVVQDGTILEEGSHADLAARGGGYARLINVQNLHREPSGSAEISRS